MSNDLVRCRKSIDPKNSLLHYFLSVHLDLKKKIERFVILINKNDNTDTESGVAVLVMGSVLDQTLV